MPSVSRFLPSAAAVPGATCRRTVPTLPYSSMGMANLRMPPPLRLSSTTANWFPPSQAMPEYSPGSMSRSVAGRGVEGGEAGRPEAAVRRLGDGCRRRETARLLRHPHDQRPRSRHRKGLYGALRGHQQQLVDALRKAVDLHPDIGAGMPDREERIALLRHRRVGHEAVLREQRLGLRVTAHGRPVLEPDRFVHHFPLRLRRAAERREHGP